MNKPLIDRNKIIFPLVQLGLMKQFVKALDKEGKCIEYIVPVGLFQDKAQKN